MKSQALVVTNNHRSSLGYTPGLAAFGLSLQEMRTFDTARIWLKSSFDPVLIVIDVHFFADEIEAFLHYVRVELGNQNVPIVIVGCDTDFMRAFGATKCLPRPADLHEIISVLEPVR